MNPAEAAAQERRRQEEERERKRQAEAQKAQDKQELADTRNNLGEVGAFFMKKFSNKKGVP